MLLTFVGFVFPIGYPISSSAVRFAMTWGYCLLGTAFFMFPVLLKLHYQFAQLAAETPPDVLQENLGVLVFLIHPAAKTILTSFISLAGFVHLFGYSIFYVFIQRDFHGTATWHGVTNRHSASQK